MGLEWNYREMEDDKSTSRIFSVNQIICTFSAKGVISWGCIYV